MDAALVGAAFYFMFLTAFHGFDFNVCLLPGGKDKLRGNTPSLPAAGSRFLIDAESGKKQTRTGGRRKEQCPFQSHGINAHAKGAWR